MSYGGNGIGRGGGGRGGGKVGAATGSRVYVGNLSWETGLQDLKDHFRAAGDVTHADIMHPRARRPRGSLQYVPVPLILAAAR